MAAFATTQLHDGQLLKEAFDKRHLVNGELSLSRSAFTSRAEFTQHVIARQEASRGAFIGIASADVARLRQLEFQAQGPAAAIAGPAVCVLDRVDPGDHDGHATLSYSEALERHRLSQTQLGKVREKIRADLADEFSAIMTLDEVFGVEPASD